MYGNLPLRCQGRPGGGARGGVLYSARRFAPGVHETRGFAYTMIALVNLIDTVITIYIWLLIASAILSWLVAFNVINTGNRFVYQIGDFLYRITEPALRPIRNVLPTLGGIDLSPLVLILLLIFARDLMNEYLRY
jgi:YggT family protein